MEWRITFFVNEAKATPDGWLVRGEAGLGPPEVGDAFTFVQHPEGRGEDRVSMLIAEAGPSLLRLVVDDPVELGRGDILGGEADR